MASALSPAAGAADPPPRLMIGDPCLIRSVYGTFERHTRRRRGGHPRGTAAEAYAPHGPSALCILGSPSSRMPGANQCTLAALRMRSTGLSQVVGVSDSPASILKSPMGSSGTPSRCEWVLRKRGRSPADQRGEHELSRRPPDMIAATPHQPLPVDLDVPARPHHGVQLPDHQIRPAGWTPRTMLRFTTSAVAPVPTPLETGITPIPPVKRESVSSARTGGPRARPVHSTRRRSSWRTRSALKVSSSSRPWTRLRSPIFGSYNSLHDESRVWELCEIKMRS
jgi:hypothetical protein